MNQIHDDTVEYHMHLSAHGGEFMHVHKPEQEHGEFIGVPSYTGQIAKLAHDPVRPPSGPCSTKIHEDSAYRIFLGSTGRITVEGKVTPRCPSGTPSWVVLWQSR